MAVIQTPRGRVVGLVIQKDDQPMPQAVQAVKEEKKPEPATPVKRAGRPSKK